MFKRLALLNVLILLSVSNVYAQVYTPTNNESKGFVRVGLGVVDFEDPGSLNNPPPRGELHFHEAAITTNFVIGYGSEYFRAMVIFDPALFDGVRGTSIVSTGVKGEVGLPWIMWLKLSGGVVYSRNHAKISDDITIYERDGLDIVWSPFWSITLLPGAGNANRFFADIRVGRSNGGDVISPQTGKPVADSYVSVSLGIHLRFRD